MTGVVLGLLTTIPAPPGLPEPEREESMMDKFELDQHLREMRETLPSPDGDAVQRLVHTLAAFAETPDEEWAIRATGGLYGDRTTGLTWGDLRQLLARLSG